MTIELVLKYDNEEIIEYQSNLTSNGFHKPYRHYDTGKIRQNEVLTVNGFI